MTINKNNVLITRVATRVDFINKEIVAIGRDPLENYFIPDEEKIVEKVLLMVEKNRI